MPRVAVVSDTTSYLSPDLVEANQILQVSLHVNYGGDRSEREADMHDLDAFYDELRSAERLPTTSQPSVGDFLATYEPLLDEGRDVVSIHISAGLSGTCESARQAALLLEREGRGGERVQVVDSSTAAGGLGLVVLAAARRAAAGTDAAGVARHAAAARSRLKMWMCLDTLEYLKRSGRIGAASAWVGSTLNVKPILTVESEITPVERVRTTARMLERMESYAHQRHASGADAWMLQHIQSPDEASALAARCEGIFGTPPQFVSEIGAVLGVHTGPGVLGLAALPAELLI